MTKALSRVRGLYDLLIERQLQVIAEDAGSVVIEGDYALDAVHASAGRLQATYRLRIEVPGRFPLALPTVYELGNAIPPEPEFHVNKHDGSLCLGTELELRAVLKETKDIYKFLLRTLEPYLYAVTARIRLGLPFVFGERAHGQEGLIEDLSERLKVPFASVRYALSLCSLRRRVANKCVCPCRCGRRLGACCTRRRVQAVRTLASRAWMRQVLQQLTKHEMPLDAGRAKMGRVTQRLRYKSELRVR